MCRSRPGRARRSSLREVPLRDASAHPASERRTVSAGLTGAHTRGLGARLRVAQACSSRAKTTSVWGSDPVDAERVVGALDGPGRLRPEPRAGVHKRPRSAPSCGEAAIGVDTRTTTAHRRTETSECLRRPGAPGRARHSFGCISRISRHLTQAIGGTGLAMGVLMTLFRRPAFLTLMFTTAPPPAEPTSTRSPATGSRSRPDTAR